ncbi:MAG: hypothetical protein IAE77_28380 [Prosthecobacter sp.]|jgi:hypothetical protein|uniref:hypothetical protein n=1 Tax=Prosthecobacter sp. TaxID=1965333 RepID=UPI0019F7B532|nr:hypothetical protein [Prosthecobacter sp.]MBE2287405.1 hypothetical protein [Prosthecobacter sp.]
MKFGFFVVAVVAALFFAVQVLKRLPKASFEEAAAAMTEEEKVANEAREYLRKRLGKDVPLAKGRHDVMNDGTVIVTQTVVYKNSADSIWVFRYSPPPRQLLLVTNDGRVVFQK